MRLRPLRSQDEATALHFRVGGVSVRLGGARWIWGLCRNGQKSCLRMPSTPSARAFAPPRKGGVPAEATSPPLGCEGAAK